MPSKFTSNGTLVLLSCITALVVAGCGPSIPSPEQLQLYLPENIRKCPLLPKVPTVKSNRTSAIYIIKLHAAAKACGANMGTVDKLYNQYRAKLKALSK